MTLMCYSGLQEERDRLNRIHEILQLMFAGKLLFPPVSNPRRVLDCGYGSGAWCVGVAEAYPECEVSLAP
jgi:methylase of polypeptide subunit release factors